MTIDYIKSKLSKSLSQKRYNHTLSTVETAIDLSKRYGCDLVKTEIAALLHDCGRAYSIEEQRNMLKDMGYSNKFLESKNLLHAPVGKIAAKKEYGIDDEEILNAIYYHTFGRADMPLLEKIIFVADAIEMGRVYEGVEEIRKVAKNNLDKAVYLCLEGTETKILKKGGYLYEETIKAKNFYKSVLDHSKYI